MSNKVTDRARVYVRFCFHFSLAGAWYPLPVLVTFFYSSQRGRPFDLWGGWGRRVWVIPGKKYPADWFRGEKKILQGNAWPKKIPTLKKKKIFYGVCWKKSYTHVCQEKTITRGLGKNLPPPPHTPHLTLLLPKSNGRPLSKASVGTFYSRKRQVQQLQMDQMNQRWQRWKRWEREQRRQHRCQTTSLFCYNN